MLSKLCAAHFGAHFTVSKAAELSSMYSVRVCVGWGWGLGGGGGCSCRHEQSFGYLAGSHKLDMQAQADPGAGKRTSGLPGDTVGPDKYNPNVAAVLTKRGVGGRS